MTTFYYGDVFDLNNQTINIHDLNLVNNIRREKIAFDTLSPLKQVLCNIDENNRDEYLENGISVNEENVLKNILNGSVDQTTFTLPTNDVIYLTNKEQNYSTLNLNLDGSMLNGQFAKINFIEFDVNGIDIDLIENINNNILNWNVYHNNNTITIESSESTFSTENDIIYNLLTIKYIEPTENWNRQVYISNLFVKSSIVEQYTQTDNVLVVPQITGGNTYNFQAINYLASYGFINDTIRIKPVNHSQQDNMFIIYSLDNVNLKSGDIIFVVDDHLFGETSKYKLRNYLCGWHEMSNSNINKVKYIAVYIDYNQETGNTISNVNYKYKMYDYDERKIYDLESQEGNKYKSLGYGSVKNPLNLTKSNVSVINNEIDGVDIYNLLSTYL